MIRFDAPIKRPLRPLQSSAADIERWLLRKNPQAIGSYRELAPEEYVRAFTVAQTAGTDIADDLYFALVDVVSRNGDFADFSGLVTPILRQKGWLKNDGQIANRVQLIYDTNMRLARAAGRWDRFQATKGVYPYLRGFTVGDERVRHPPKSPHSDHRAFDGIILPVDHWFWTVYWTPLGFRCRCAITQMSRSELARSKLGVTSDDELQARIARLGPPVFASPAKALQIQMAGVVEATNTDGGRMPGMPPVDPVYTEHRGRALWQSVLRVEAADAVGAAIAKLFGLAA